MNALKIASRETMDQVTILAYEERLRPDFTRLNQEWLEGSGLLEEADNGHLYSPRESIIEKGGQIFFAVEKGQVLGTCAAIYEGGSSVEIAKLAVASLARRRGIGRLLTSTVIEHARCLGAKKVVLVSNRKLKSAIRLYESMGFCHRPLPAQPGYASADVYMELLLSAGY